METVTVIILLFLTLAFLVKRASDFRRSNGYGRIFKGEVKKQEIEKKRIKRIAGMN